ncbi:MAG TPA: response regulator [Chitinophagales bacterium]|nr:response regulator [Chitinophagales bacterium]
MIEKIKLAIIEDELLIAESLKLLLCDLGYEVSFMCHTYEDALQNLTPPSCYDLMLLDINLNHSHKSGIDLARELSLLQKPFIFVTALSDRDTIRQAVIHKPAAYLVKPVHEGTLFAAVQTAIENYKNQTPAAPPNEDQAELEHFFIKLGNRLHKIEWIEVYALIANKNYVSLLTHIQPSGFPIRSSLQQTIAKIVPRPHRSRYLQVNRATAIDKNIITSLTENEVITPIGTFELGSIFAKEVKKQLNLL